MNNTNIYLVGRLDETDGTFHLYDYRSATNDYNFAKKLREEAYKKNTWYRPQIFKINTKDMEIMETDAGLQEFSLLRELLNRDGLLTYCWYQHACTEDTSTKTLWIEKDITYDSKTNTATIKIKHDMERHYRYYGQEPTEEMNRKGEEVAARNAKATEDIKTFITYGLIPVVKEILESRNLNIRVDVKLFGKKAHKGFITK